MNFSINPSQSKDENALYDSTAVHTKGIALNVILFLKFRVKFTLLFYKIVVILTNF